MYEINLHCKYVLSYIYISVSVLTNSTLQGLISGLCITLTNCEGYTQVLTGIVDVPLIRYFVCISNQALAHLDPKV